MKVLRRRSALLITVEPIWPWLDLLMERARPQWVMPMAFMRRYSCARCPSYEAHMLTEAEAFWRRPHVTPLAA